MNVRKRLFVSMGVLVAGLMLFSGTTFAGYAYEGSDYSFTVNSNQQVTVCDGEDDGYGAYGYFESKSGTYATVTDTNGALSGCNTSGSYGAGIKRHQTCENRGVWADPCSSWVAE